MKNKLAVKIGMIALLILSMQFPLWMVEDLTRERTRFRQEAKENIAQSWTGSQSLIGPILVLPYTVNETSKIWDDHKNIERTVTKNVTRHLHILADSLTIDSTANTEERHRGLYAVPVYTLDLKIKAVFSNQQIINLLRNAQSADNLNIGTAYITIAVSDLRGVVKQPYLKWSVGDTADTSDNSLEFNSGSMAFNNLAGMHALLDKIDWNKVPNLNINTQITLRGMEQIHVTPVSKDTTMQLTSSWQHPSFIGHYLPIEHKIGDNGFSAKWQASSFSGDIAGAVARCADGDCSSLEEDYFGVSFITPVDIYQQSTRAVKYGILFISITFLAFFLLEVLWQVRLHPMHYLLVGSAIATFYLLLLSFSEHTTFATSYLIAAIGCSVLLGIYLSGAMRKWFYGLIFAIKFLGLYGMLYLILLSEDNALLMGSLLIFVVLAMVMLVTRNTDWYALGENMESKLKVSNYEQSEENNDKTS